MRFLTEHVENFETGTAGPTNVKLAAVLGQSMAFMNAALDAQATVRSKASWFIEVPLSPPYSGTRPCPVHVLL